MAITMRRHSIVRIMGAPSRPEAVGGGGEVRVEDWHQHLMRRLLDEPVQYR
ncbi:hypothetical protein ACCS93_36575 [Rhizobium ruizarguesonis]